MNETIDTAYLTDFLEQLLGIPSPTGYTDQIVRHCCAELENLGIDYELTRRGAIRAVIRGEHHRPGRAMIAHVDTIGAQVKAIKDNGRAELVPIGSWSSRFAEGARVTLFTRSGAYHGTILPMKASGHTFGPAVDTQETGWQHVELRVDVELEDDETLEDHGVAIGDYVAVHPQPEILDNGYINSRHLDDKAGVACLFAALKALKEAGAKPEVDTYFLFSLAEEVGVGASSVLHGDIASMVAIDNGTTAPGQNSSEKGVTIGMADSSGPFDYHLTYKLIDLCVEHRIPFQRDIFRFYRTDAASAIEAGNDIRTALITFGVDASHGWERIHVNALESVTRLVIAYTNSPVKITRDREELGSLEGFTSQPTELSDEGS